MESGIYWWCACGRSKNQPFCDGSHKGTSFTPEKVIVKEFLSNPIGSNKERLARLIGCDIQGNTLKVSPCKTCIHYRPSTVHEIE